MSNANPYQSPATTPEQPPMPSSQTRIVRNLRAICVLYVIFGSLAVLGGTGIFFDGSDKLSPVVAGMIVLLGLCGAVSAMGVLRRKAWGVPFCQLVSAVYLMSFPIGTILGAYFLFKVGKVKDQFR